MSPVPKIPPDAQLPPSGQWDFRANRLPEDQVHECYTYEFGLHSRDLTALVSDWRANTFHQTPTFDDIVDLVGWRDPLRIQRDRLQYQLVLGAYFYFPEFPSKHYLDINPGVRRERLQKLVDLEQQTSPRPQITYKFDKRLSNAQAVEQFSDWLAETRPNAESPTGKASPTAAARNQLMLLGKCRIVAANRGRWDVLQKNRPIFPQKKRWEKCRTEIALIVSDFQPVLRTLSAGA